VSCGGCLLAATTFNIDDDLFLDVDFEAVSRYESFFDSSSVLDHLVTS
jgi:hypothetical protein